VGWTVPGKIYLSLIVPGAPGLPEKPIEFNSTFAVLKWKEPEDPNGEIINYRVNLVILSTNRLAYDNSGNSGSRRRRRATESEDVIFQCVTGNMINVNRNLTTGNSMTSIIVYDLSKYSQECTLQEQHKG